VYYSFFSLKDYVPLEWENRMRMILAAAALAAAALGLSAGAASADDNGDQAPHSTAPVGVTLVNGDVSVADDACVAPWHWDGPVQVITDNGPYQACQDPGGTQSDAPAIDLHGDTAPKPLPHPQG